MWWALIKKELREIWPLGLAAAVAHLLVVGGLMGVEALNRIPVLSWFGFIPSRPSEIPFAGRTFVSYFTIISAGFITSLAFRQIAWEEIKGTYLFLLHRPMTRISILLAKVIAGLSLYAVVSLVPILVYGMWAATPGNHPSPFEWSMTEGAFRIMVSTPIVYLGVFILWLRPGRWFGTRLLPLVTCGAIAAALPWTPYWWPVGFLLTALAGAILILHIGYWTETRDFG